MESFYRSRSVYFLCYRVLKRQTKIVGAPYDLPLLDIVLAISLIHFIFRTHIGTCSHKVNSIRETSGFLWVIYETLFNSKPSLCFAFNLELL